VRIDWIDVVHYDYPQLVLDVSCGGGTYIRTLGRDIARRLRTDAVMSALVRTAIGELRVENACLADDLTPENLPSYLLPPLFAVADLPRVELTPEQVKHVSHGRAIAGKLPPRVEAAAVDTGGRLVAILARRTDDSLTPVRNVASRETESG
jgi:tRNA pseudouridine55 synthase